MKKRYLIILIFLYAFSSNAQQDPQYTQYMYNMNVINPAYAGSSEGLLVILAIIVWIGWHVLTSKSESEELERLARKRHGANDHKSNITDW